MDVRRVRKDFPRLGMIGGLDKRALAQGKEAIDAELEAKVEEVWKTGGYLPALDHLIPPDVSYDNFKYYVTRMKEIFERL